MNILKLFSIKPLIATAIFSFPLIAETAPAYTISKLQETLASKPHIQGKNVRVWSVKKNETIRINLVEMTGELSLHMHPDAEHSLVVLKGKVKAQIGDNFTDLQAGDFISIPRSVPHKYWATAEGALLMSMDAPYYDPKNTVILEEK